MKFIISTFTLFATTNASGSWTPEFNSTIRESVSARTERTIAYLSTLTRADQSTLINLGNNVRLLSNGIDSFEAKLFMAVLLPEKADEFRIFSSAKLISLEAYAPLVYDELFRRRVARCVANAGDCDSLKDLVSRSHLASALFLKHSFRGLEAAQANALVGAVLELPPTSFPLARFLRMSTERIDYIHAASFCPEEETHHPIMCALLSSLDSGEITGHYSV